MSGTPTVAAVVTGYGRTEFIAEALRSIRGQVVAPDEVVAVADFPVRSDGVTWEEVDDRDQGPKVVAAVRACHSDVIAFLDDDDLWAPGKVMGTREAFSDPAVSFFNHRHVEFYDGVTGRRPLWKVWWDLKGGYVRYGPHVYYGNASSIAVRRSSLEEYLVTLSHVSLAVDDALFWLALESGGLSVASGVPLSRVRVHGGNSSRPRGPLLELSRRRLATYNVLAEVIRGPLRPEFDKVYRKVRSEFDRATGVARG